MCIKLKSQTIGFKRPFEVYKFFYMSIQIIICLLLKSGARKCVYTALCIWGRMNNQLDIFITFRVQGYIIYKAYIYFFKEKTYFRHLLYKVFSLIKLVLLRSYALSLPLSLFNEINHLCHRCNCSLA